MLGLLQRRKEETPLKATSADISGSVNDSQLAIGEHIVQNNIAAGAIVNQIAAEQAPQPPRPRDKPVSVKPREAPPLVGRDTELAAANAALSAREPVQFSGRPGAGKTAMLRHLAHGTTGAFPDGVIYYRSRRESLDDLLLRLFEFLYACEERVKPTNAELCLYLEEMQALLLLDDVDLDREDLETLLLTLPRSVFVFGSPERSLWCDGTAIGLRGLGDDAALMLVEQYLERPLAEREREEFVALSRALDGQPLQIIKAVTQVREEGVTPREILPPGSPLPSAPAQLSAQMAETLTPEARQALMLIAALRGAPLHVDHVAALTGSPDAAALLADLEARGLTKSHSPRYSVTDATEGVPSEAETKWRRKLLSYFADHAEAHWDAPERLRDDLEPIIASLRGGAAAGEWRAVLRLARAADRIASASKLWGAWEEILLTALDAARSIGDAAEEAWALHQLGTRALCLGDADEAGRRLADALRIRERIGDRAAEITRNNMGHLPGPPPPPGQPPAGPTGPLGVPAWMAPLCAGIVALALVTGLVSAGIGDDRRLDDPPAAVAISAVQDKDRPTGERHDSSGGGRPVAHRGAGREAEDIHVGPDEHGSRVAPNRPDESLGDNGSGPGDGRGSEGEPPAHELTEPAAPDPITISSRERCTPEVVDGLRSLVERELAVLRSLLAADVPGALQAQIDILQDLLDHLGGRCDPQVETIVRGVQDAVAALVGDARGLVAGL